MADIKLIFAQDQNKYNDGKMDGKMDGKGSLLKKFFIDNPQTFINLVSQTPDGPELKKLNDFYNGKSNETEVIEILRNVNNNMNVSGHDKFANQCLHQECVLGYIKNGSEYKGILNKKGEIKYLDESKPKHNRDKLEALYEPFSLFKRSKKEPKPKNDEDSDDEDTEEKSPKAKKLSLKDQFTKYNKKMTMSLKKLKSTVGLPDVKSMNINFNSILGQIVDNSEQYTRGLIMESEEYKQKLILIKPTKVLKGVPVFAILTTD